VGGLVDLVLGRSQVAESESATQAAMQTRRVTSLTWERPHNRLDLLEHLGVYPHLAVSAILVSAAMNAEQAKLTQPKAQAESSEDRHGKNEHQTF